MAGGEVGAANKPDVRFEFENILSGPLSSNGHFRLFYSGAFRSKELRNLIRQLAIMQDWLEADEREEAEQSKATDAVMGSP